MRLVALAAVVAVALPALYLARGGGEFSPTPPGDPCTRGAPVQMTQGGTAGALERLTLTALDGAACDLGTTREALLLALGDERELPSADPDRQEDAVRAGLRRAIDAEAERGALSGGQAQALRVAVELLPIRAVLDRLLEPS